MSENHPQAPLAPGTGPLDFAKVISTGTLSRMSGGLSVLLPLVAACIPSTFLGWATLLTKDGLVVLGIISFFWTAYAAWEAERTRANSLQAKVASQGRLEMDYIPGQRQFEEVKQGLYKPRRILSVRVRNIGGAPVRGCKMYFVSIEPDEERRAGDIRMPSFTEVGLNPGDFAYVPLATYNEAGTHLKGDSLGALHVPATPTSGPGDERLLGTDTDYIITLRATGDKSEVCTRQFRIWIREGRLHMEASGELLL